MRRFPASPRHRPTARVPIIPAGEDDLSTWGNTAQLTTMALPGTSANFYPLVVDVSRVINSAAKADVGALRFRHDSGVRLAHKRTAGGRVLLIGNFHGGRNTLNYYWGKPGAIQPGNGFPSADESLAGYRLGLIFDNSAPLDISPDPATFSVVGTPGYESYMLGQSMRFADGSYIETTAAKLRGAARNSRAIFASISLPSTTENHRVMAWYNRITSQRGCQLWIRPDGLEFYVSDNGTTFQRWLLLGAHRAGPNAIGTSWKANELNSLLLCNESAEVVPSDWNVAAGPIFDSSEPFVIGGTHVPGEFFTGTVRAYFERYDEFASPDHFHVWRFAWEDNDSFWGIADRTPDSIDVPDLTNVPANTEVAFARNEITGISAQTPISVTGPGSPSYSVGSSFSAIGDVLSKRSTPGEVGPGNWLATYHTSAGNSTVRETSVTVGTVTSPRRSTAVAAGGAPYTPGAPADYTVSTVAELLSAVNSASGGNIIEVLPGNLKPQGQVLIQNRDFRGGPPVEIRSATIPYRGYLPSEGGLLVPGETSFTTGSGGTEFASFLLKNVHNMIFTGIRTYQGDVGTAGSRWPTFECVSCTQIVVQNSKLCGYKPTSALKLWATDKYRPNNGLWNQGRGVTLGVGGGCDAITFKKTLMHWFNVAFYNAAASNTLLEDCILADQIVDNIKTDGQNTGFTMRRGLLYRIWSVKEATGGIAHNDNCQNTTKTQPGWKDHTLEYVIFCPGDTSYPHHQNIFYECDNYPSYPRGTGLYVTNCFIDSRAINTIYSRPGDKLIVTKTTVLQNQFGGLNEMNEDGTDSLIDTTFNNPLISVSSATANGKSFGNNVLDRSVYVSHDLNAGLGDQVLNSTQLLKASYGGQLEDFPAYNGPLRSAGVPALPLMSSAAFKPLRLLNTSYVLAPTELRRAAPKTSSTIHPNAKGMHYGCSELFQLYGALP